MITISGAHDRRFIPASAIVLALLLAAPALSATAGEMPAVPTNSPAAVNVTAETNTAAPADLTAGTNDAAGDKAWEETSKALASPAMPAAWRTNAPTLEEEAAFYLPLLTRATDQARDFYTRFPDHPRAADARRIEFNLLTLAVQKYHDTNQVEHLAALRKESIKAPGTSPDDKFSLRVQEVVDAAVAKKAEGREAVFTELEKGARELLKEFPQKQEVYAILLDVAGNSSGEKARALYREIQDNATAGQLKMEAEAGLKKLEALGKPLALAYTAVDGRKVDLAKLKGKVVLVDFWATWCVPCVAEMPEVKSVYAKLHGKGFEIIGISLDQKKEALKQFVKENDMAWPQYFEDGDQPNRFAEEHEVDGIPAMWLVDKKGIVVDLDARGELEEKVSKLLAQ